MNVTRRKIAAAAAVAGSLGALGLMSGRSRRADKQIVIKFSHVVAADTPKGKAANYFSRQVERESSGELRVDVYPNSTLYKDGEELEALQLGVVDLIAPSLSKLAPLGINEFEIFDLPYLFTDYEQLHKVTQGEVGRALMARIEKVGLLGLAFWDNGFKNMSANRPLQAPRDFRGLKMRIQASIILAAQMRALGADPQVIALADLHDALANGIVDGCENPNSNFLTQNLCGIQKFMTVSNHGYLGYLVMMNRAFWRQLPNRIQDVLVKCMADATRYANDIAKTENDAALTQIASIGKTEILHLTDAQRGEWRKKFTAVYDEFDMHDGAKLIRRIARNAV